MSSTLAVDDVLEALCEVVDPEVNVPIIEMGEGNGLIDEVKISDDNSVEVKYHATTPYCPPVFALQISMDIKRSVEKMKESGSVKVFVSGHSMSQQINEKVNSNTD